MFGFLQRRRRARLRAQPLNDAWRAWLDARVPLYAHLPDALRRDVDGHVQVLLSEKRFEGCGGLTLTDEMRVTIAGHAALLLIGREPRYFPRLYSVLVYPNSYAVPVTDQLADGLVTEHDEERLGESWTDGVIVLAWDEVVAATGDTTDGTNVVLHEFAHQLDSEDGDPDGVPALGKGGDYAAWRRALGREFERLRTSPDESILDEYGAEDPAEFFAVATESFFEIPFDVRDRHPELYAALATYFGVDPARILSDS